MSFNGLEQYGNDLSTFRESIKQLRQKHRDIPIDLIQSALDLDSSQDYGFERSTNFKIKFYNTSNTKFEDLTPIFTTYQMIESISLTGYDSLVNYAKKEFIKYINSELIRTPSYNEKFLTKDEISDIGVDLINFKRMVKCTKVLLSNGFIIVDPCGYNSPHDYSSKDILNIVENYYFKSWNFLLTVDFNGAESKTEHFDFTPGAKNYIQCLYHLVKAQRVNLDNVIIIKLGFPLEAIRKTHQELIKDVLNENKIEFTFIDSRYGNVNNESTKKYCYFLVEITNDLDRDRIIKPDGLDNLNIPGFVEFQGLF